LSGNSGTGKTTLAKIIADKTVSGEFEIVEIVGRELTTLNLRSIMERWIYCGGHALIVNESHGLTKPVIEKLLDVLENLPETVCVIFTTTREGNDLFEEQLDSSPFSSRCINLSLASRGLAPIFADRAREIARLESLDGRPEAEYMKLVNRHKSNMRAVLTEIESGVML
jgi:replication-associated recombination protein RarA